jgi:hypothetical protein
MKKYFAHIWLDDFRPPAIQDPYKESIVWVKTYDEFVNQVKVFGDKISNCIVHFDHDLGEGKDGYDCAKFLINWCIDNEYPAPDYDIQSANPIGRENIDSLFKSYWKVFNKKSRT